jgi:hypothetical protein
MAKEQGPVMVMYSSWDILVRELGGGIWFWTSLWLVVAFLAYIGRSLLSERHPDRILLYAAGSLVLYFTGSTIRGLITWMQFYYAGNQWDTGIWIATWPWFGLSVLCNITGAALCIWFLSSWRWRLIFTVCAVAGALMVPVTVRWLL